MNNKKPFFILIPIAIFFAIGAVVMALWNLLIPDIFALPPLHYWQALGLFLLSRILLGNFGFGNKKPFMNNRFKEKMMNMSEEERQQFKTEWEKRCKR
jgi:hypothetical protein